MRTGARLAVRALALVCVVGLLVAVGPGAALAAPGELDGSYATGGVFTAAFQSPQSPGQLAFAAVDSQRRTVVAATHVDAQNRSHLDVMRLTPQGTVDTSFGSGGVVEVDFSASLNGLDLDVLARGVAIGSGDKVLALGWVNDPQHGNEFTALVRLNSDGSYDTTFGSNHDGRAVDLRSPNWTSLPDSLAVDGNGRILVGGSCGSGCGGFVARYTDTGAPDTGGFNATDALHPGVQVIGQASDVSSLAALADGSVLAAGGSSPTDDAVIAKVRPDGLLDASFNAGGATPGVVTSGMGRSNPQTSVAVAYGVAAGPGGSVYATGEVADNGITGRLLRLTQVGTPDGSFGSGSPATGVVSIPGTGARGVAVTVDGSSCPVIAGFATAPNNSLNSQILAARFTPAGQPDQAFNPNGPTPGTAMFGVGDSAFGQTIALQGDGNLVIGGYRQQGTGPVDRRAVAVRLQGGGCGGGTPAPSAVTGPPSGITSDGATFNGTVNPNGSQVTDCHFDYGPGPGLQYGNRAPCSPAPGAGTSPVAVSATLSGLGSGKTWNYRLVATGPGGTSTGDNETLTTAPPPTTLSTTQVWGTTRGASITVPGSATGEHDEAQLSGANASSSSGSFTYSLYRQVASGPQCTGTPVFTSTVPIFDQLNGGASSQPVPTRLTPDTYYWEVSYSGDSANQPTTSPCGSEILTVFAPHPAHINGPALANGGVVTLALSCPTLCRARITLTVSALPLAADARGKGKGKPPVITLAHGTVTIRKHGAQKVTLRLTGTGRRFIASHHGRITATATIATTINGHTNVVKNRLTLKIAKRGKHGPH